MACNIPHRISRHRLPLECEENWLHEKNGLQNAGRLRRRLAARLVEHRQEFCHQRHIAEHENAPRPFARSRQRTPRQTQRDEHSHRKQTKFDKCEIFPIALATPGIGSLKKRRHRFTPFCSRAKLVAKIIIRHRSHFHNPKEIFPELVSRAAHTQILGAAVANFFKIEQHSP